MHSNFILSPFIDSYSVHPGLHNENAVLDASNESNKMHDSQQELVSLPAASKKEQDADESSAAFEDVSLGEADVDVKQETEKTQEMKAHTPWSTRFVASVTTSNSNKQETNFENLYKVSGVKEFGVQQSVPDSCAVQNQSLEDIMAQKSLRGRFGRFGRLFGNRQQHQVGDTESESLSDADEDDSLKETTKSDPITVCSEASNAMEGRVGRWGRLFGNQQQHQVGDTESESSSDAEEDDSLKETTKSDPITVCSEASNAMEGHVGRWGNAFRNYYAVGKDMDQSNDDDHTDGDSESTTSHSSSSTLESVDPSELLEENGDGPNVTANRPWTRLWRAQEFTSDSSPTVHFI
jgi:hypothetical protein